MDESAPAGLECVSRQRGSESDPSGPSSQVITRGDGTITIIHSTYNESSAVSIRTGVRPRAFSSGSISPLPFRTIVVSGGRRLSESLYVVVWKVFWTLFIHTSPPLCLPSMTTKAKRPDLSNFNFRGAALQLVMKSTDCLCC